MRVAIRSWIAMLCSNVMMQVRIVQYLSLRAAFFICYTSVLLWTTKTFHSSPLRTTSNCLSAVGKTLPTDVRTNRKASGKVLCPCIKSCLSGLITLCKHDMSELYVREGCEVGPEFNSDASSLLLLQRTPQGRHQNRCLVRSPPMDRFL